jgi:hypothetical protein
VSDIPQFGDPATSSVGDLLAFLKWLIFVASGQFLEIQYFEKDPCGLADT